MKQAPLVRNPSEDKSAFRKVTVTIPPGMYELLVRESARRKIAGEPNQQVSALLREALAEYLTRHGAILNTTPEK